MAPETSWHDGRGLIILSFALYLMFEIANVHYVCINNSMNSSIWSTSVNVIAICQIIGNHHQVKFLVQCHLSNVTLTNSYHASVIYTYFADICKCCQINEIHGNASFYCCNMPDPFMFNLFWSEQICRCECELAEIGGGGAWESFMHIQLAVLIYITHLCDLL